MNQQLRIAIRTRVWLMMLLVAPGAWAQIPLTSLNTAYTQDFNTLATSGTSSALPVGFFLVETGTAANTTYTGGTGSSNTGDTYSFGAVGSTDRAFGTLQSGSVVPTVGAFFTNNTGAVVTSLGVSYTGEEWRLGTVSRTDRLDFQYSTNATSTTTGTYVDVDALDFSTLNTATVGAKDGNDAANRTVVSSTITGLSIPNGATFYIRFADFNATGADDGLAIDDFSLTPIGTAAGVTLSINDVSVQEGNAGTTTATFTVNLSSPAPAGGVTFDIATADNTATTADNDYVAKNLTGQTIPAGSSTYTFDVMVNGDVVSEPNETFFVNVTNVTGVSIADGQGQGTIVNDDAAPVTRISAIQGSGSTAALTGTQTIEGIVTRTFSGATALNGFYVQEEDADSDNNPASSEGIFVFDPTGQFSGNAGDKVRITGTVAEFTSASASLTQLRDLTSVVNLGASTLPTVTNVQFPVANVSDLERFEGMLVNATAAGGNLTVTEYFQLGRFGQVVLSANGASNQTGTDARLDQYTQFNLPSTSGYAAYLAEIAKRRIILDDGRGVSNPDPIIFGRGGQPLSASNTLRGGDGVASITAILDERFEGYRLQTSTGVDFQPANPRPTLPPTVGGTLKVVSFNVLNYFNGNGTGSGFPTSRGADTQAEFTRQRDKILQAISGSGGDVVGLIEIENDGYGSTSAIQDLVNGLNTLTGPGSYTFIDPATSLGTDEITVGIIYKPAKVTPVGAAAAIPNGFGQGSFDVVGRKPLAQTFRDNAANALFTAVVNHFKSKGSSSGGAGDGDATDGQSLSNGTRTRQSQDLTAWLATNPTGTTDPDYLLLGDLNSYALEDPIRALTDAGYTDLVPNTSYSFVFDGQVGSLDYALANGSLRSQVTGAEKWHINADEPNVLDYNTEFKSAGQVGSLYNADPFRSSDHDPVVVGLSLTSVPVTTALSLTFTANPTQIQTSGTTTLSAMVSGGTTPYRYVFSGPGTISQMPTSSMATVSGLMTGVQTFTVTVTDATTPTSQTITGTVSVTVTEPAPDNTAPTTTGIANQTATVNQPFSLDVAPSFSDNETPNSLTFSATGLPSGLSLSGSTISGTPTTAGMSMVTVTATDPGNLSVSAQFTLTVNPAPTNTGPFAITSVTTVSCETVTAGERRVRFTPQYAGTNGQPISFSVVNELSSTTAPGPYTLRLYTDNPVITLKATQSGTAGEASFTYNWLAACNNTGMGARVGAEPGSLLNVRVLGNPVQDGRVSIEVRGAAGEPLRLMLTDLRGQSIGSHRVEQASTVERHTFEISRQSVGLLLLRATTPTQSQTVKVMKAD